MSTDREPTSNRSYKIFTLCLLAFPAFIILYWTISYTPLIIEPSESRIEKKIEILDQPTELWKVPQSSFHKRLQNLRQPAQTCTKDHPCTFGMIADLDTSSRLDSEELLFKSYFLEGRVYYDTMQKKYTVSCEQFPKEIRGKYNEGGRGLELSELIYFDKQLLAFDDRTGIVYEYTLSGKLVPRHVIPETKYSDKGMKIEWATEKDGMLWIGSFGKEYTDPAGFIQSEANFYIAILNRNGSIKYLNWKPIYEKLRKQVGAVYPGYIVHEAILWSCNLKQWVILPRRLSQHKYDEKTDEIRGTNIMFLASEDFSVIQLKTVGQVVPRRGFSAFKFLPGTKDTVIIAIKSYEDTIENIQKSYLTIFETLTGHVLLEDTEISFPAKFEGIEILPQGSHFSTTNPH